MGLNRDEDDKFDKDDSCSSHQLHPGSDKAFINNQGGSMNNSRMKHNVFYQSLSAPLRPLRERLFVFCGKPLFTLKNTKSSHEILLLNLAYFLFLCCYRAKNIFSSFTQ